MITPTPIIIPGNYTPNFCPKCGKPENIKSVCSYCGYEYPDEEGNEREGIGYIIVIILLIVFFIAWGTVTCFDWFHSDGRKTLLDILVLQWKWLKSLRVY